MWECRLEDDHGEAKCIVDYKEEMGNNNQEFLRSGSDYGVEFKNSHLLNIPSDLLETIMELCLERVYFHFVNRQRTWRERRVDTNPHNVCFSAFDDRDLFVFCEEGEVIIINNLGKEDCTRDVVEHKAPK
nr:alcohol dehydrogenase, C-terminal [Tanacetum cinerariifolium]